MKKEIVPAVVVVRPDVVVVNKTPGPIRQSLAPNPNNNNNNNKSNISKTIRPPPKTTTTTTTTTNKK